MLTADPDADLEAALADFRRARRRKRLADIHWIDALYQAYLAALLGGAAVLIGAGFVRDGFLTPSQLERLTRDGADWIGLVTAVLGGCRYRCRGWGGTAAPPPADARR